MTTSKQKSAAVEFLERASGGPLTLGGLLRAIREGEEWSLAEMAERLGVSRGYVSNLEHGKPVSPESAARYAKILGYGQSQFVRLALQDQLRRAGLGYRIELHKPRGKKKAS